MVSSAEPTVLCKHENGLFCIWIHAILQRLIDENCSNFDQDYSEIIDQD